MANEFIGEPWRLPYAAQTLQNAVTNQVPRIGTNGNWEVWDISTNAWVDTGVAADPQTAKIDADDIAPVETASTASQAYAVNSFLVYNGQLYRVTAAIAQGDTLTVGTNIAAADVGTYLAMVAANPSTSGFQKNMGIVEDTTYSGCFYRMNGGVQEWVNPPLVVGAEYRTTERYGGKPVYCVLMDFGTLPNASTKSVNLPNVALGEVANIVSTQFDIVRAVTGGYTNMLVGIEPNVTSLRVEASVNVNAYVKIITTTDFSNYKGLVLVKYTKTFVVPA